MAYECIRRAGKECDGCQDCQPTIPSCFGHYENVFICNDCDTCDDCKEATPEEEIGEEDET